MLRTAKKKTWLSRVNHALICDNKMNFHLELHLHLAPWLLVYNAQWQCAHLKLPVQDLFCVISELSIPVIQTSMSFVELKDVPDHLDLSQLFTHIYTVLIVIAA